MKAGEVHLWRIGLNREPAELEELRNMLSPDELDRAHRFHFEVDRKHFIAARGQMRKILSQYTGVNPCELTFEYAEFGKPRLSLNCAGDRVRFNLSHSRDRALLAVSNGAEIGVDVEYIDPAIDWEAVSGVSFSHDEIGALRAQDEASRAVLFYEIWTRKEAYLKALGCGLSRPTSSFSVLPNEKLDFPIRIYPLQPRQRFAGAVASTVELNRIEEFELKGNH